MTAVAAVVAAAAAFAVTAGGAWLLVRRRLGELARAHRYDRSLAVIVLDLDDFKAINDRLGHLAGDEALAEAGVCVREVVRSADVACRIGGDELAVILPEASAEDADRIYQRLQDALAARAGATAAGRLSVSAGVAEATREDDAAMFFRRADEALYKAKAQGKSQIARATG